MDNGVKLMNGAGDMSKVEDSLLLNSDLEDSVEANGIDEGSKSPHDKSLSDSFPSDRIKRKAKRLTKHLAKEASNGSGPVVIASRHLKNSRKPRSGFGRGLPKKGNTSHSHLLVP